MPGRLEFSRENRVQASSSFLKPAVYWLTYSHSHILEFLLLNDNVPKRWLALQCTDGLCWPQGQSQFSAKCITIIHSIVGCVYSPPGFYLLLHTWQAPCNLLLVWQETKLMSQWPLWLWYSTQMCARIRFFLYKFCNKFVSQSRE